MFVYKNGVYYIDSLQETVDAQGEDNGEDTDEIYISIQMISGMSLPMIFLSRHIIIRKITKKTVC